MEERGGIISDLIEAVKRGMEQPVPPNSFLDSDISDVRGPIVTRRRFHKVFLSAVSNVLTGTSLLPSSDAQAAEASMRRLQEALAAGGDIIDDNGFVLATDLEQLPSLPPLVGEYEGGSLLPPVLSLVVMAILGAAGGAYVAHENDKPPLLGFFLGGAIFPSLGFVGGCSAKSMLYDKFVQCLLAGGEKARTFIPSGSNLIYLKEGNISLEVPISLVGTPPSAYLEVNALYGGRTPEIAYRIAKDGCLVPLDNTETIEIENFKGPVPFLLRTLSVDENGRLLGNGTAWFLDTGNEIPFPVIASVRFNIASARIISLFADRQVGEKVARLLDNRSGGHRLNLSGCSFVLDGQRVNVDGLQYVQNAMNSPTIGTYRGIPPESIRGFLLTGDSFEGFPVLTTSALQNPVNRDIHIIIGGVCG